MKSTKNRARVPVTAFMALAICVASGSSMAAADDGEGIGEGIASVVSSVAPDMGEAARGIEGIDSLVVEANGVRTTIPKLPQASIVIESVDFDSPAFTVGLPQVGGVGQGRQAGEGSIVYQGDLVDIAVQPYQDGSISISTVINGPEAPSEYAYALDIPQGATANLLDTGAVVVTDANGQFISGIGVPWAKDANGVDLPTRYRVEGNTLVQEVDFSAETAFPVVADSWLFKALISSATWKQYTEGWTLLVAPTTWARSWPGNYDVGLAGWHELYDKYHNRGLNTNLQGMQRQYICRQQLVAIRYPNKETWNLDEWRPNYSHIQTVNSQCNPGGNKWFD